MNIHNQPPGRRLQVDWHDEQWTPQVVHHPSPPLKATQALRLWRGRMVRTLFGWGGHDPARSHQVPPASARPDSTTAPHRVRFAFFPFFNHRPPPVPVLNEQRFTKPLTHRFFYRRHGQGFTLIELLVVIAIIAILAGILLPVLSGVKKRAKIAQARTEMTNLRGAIKAYEADYHRFPATREWETKAGDKDLTLGLTTASNSVAMQILMNLDTKPDGANKAHVRNPKNVVYFEAKPAASDRTGGLGTDEIFRDPWGFPYIITMDLNGDNRCYDEHYSVLPQGADPKPKGLQYENGWYLNGDIMIWSVGADGKTTGNDNILSWE
jgi:prepilin-type N-terminal cleavage/methylation domain-containing protein